MPSYNNCTLFLNSRHNAPVACILYFTGRNKLQRSNRSTLTRCHYRFDKSCWTYDTIDQKCQLSAVPVRGTLEWYGHCQRQCIEACSDGLSARKKNNSPSFSVVWMGSCSTVVLCTALSLTSAFHVIHAITERKKSESTPKACYVKTNPADSW